MTMATDARKEVSRVAHDVKAAVSRGRAEKDGTQFFEFSRCVLSLSGNYRPD